MCNDKIKLVIVDDHPLIIEGLKNLLLQQDHIAVVANFNKGYDLLCFLKSNQVNIVLLDISLPDINGVELCLEIKKVAPATCIVALSNHTERSIVLKMLQNGASGYLLKSTTIAALMAGIKGALDGKVTFSAAVQDIIANQNPVNDQQIAQLTKREKEILVLIASGKTTQCIADELFLSKLTIETHRKNLLTKLDAKNVAELIKKASNADLL